jgi:hypothetical protein
MSHARLPVSRDHRLNRHASRERTNDGAWPHPARATGDLIIAIGKRGAGGRAALGQVEVRRLVDGGLLRFGRADVDHLVTAQPGHDGAGTPATRRRACGAGRSDRRA